MAKFINRVRILKKTTPKQSNFIGKNGFISGSGTQNFKLRRSIV